MGGKTLSGGLVVHSPTEALEIRQRFGVALPGFFGVAANNLLEAGVLGHGQASPRHPRPPATRCWKMACDVDDREGESPSPMEPRLGRTFRGSATGRRRARIFADTLSLRQAWRTGRRRRR